MFISLNSFKLLAVCTFYSYFMFLILYRNHLSNISGLINNGAVMNHLYKAGVRYNTFFMQHNEMKQNELEESLTIIDAVFCSIRYKLIHKIVNII